MKDTRSEQFRQWSNQILADELNYGILKTSVEHLNQLLAETGGIQPYNTLRKKDNTDLPGGVAISPGMAAFCATDLARTRTFLRGIKQGIEYLLKTFPGETLQIVYAGTGPYAMLVLPLLHHFTPAQVQFTFLDIHEESVRSVEKIVSRFNLGAYIRAIHQADACLWKWEATEKLHACISETMQATLKREPQVAITLHMARYICSGGIMLPEKIEVEAVLVNAAWRQRNIGATPIEEPASVSLGNIAVLDLQRAREAAGNYRHILHGSRAVLPVTAGLFDLVLLTHIQVWGTHVLSVNESGLTLPYLLAEGNELQTAQSIALDYDQWPDAMVKYRLA